MASRAVPTWLLVLLPLAAGFGAGVLVGPSVHELTVRRAWARVAAREAAYSARRRDPAQWRRDSAAAAAWRAHAARRPRLAPREVRRVQALSACAVSVEVRDTAWRRFQLLNAHALEPGPPGRIVAEGWAFQPGGFRPGDTVTVVLPDLWCGDFVLGGYGASLVPPAAPVGVEVR